MNQVREGGLERRVAELRAELGQREAAMLAQASGAAFVNGRLEMKLCETAVTIDLTDFVARDIETGEPLDPLTQALVVYYLHTADGAPPANHWIAFTELPDGRFYTQAFQGYTGRELTQAFGNDVARFREAAVALGGTAVPFADAAFRFQALPRVPVLVVCWQGDEDFPPSHKILFDAHAPHYLPTDACAILGSMLTRRLLSHADPKGLP